MPPQAQALMGNYQQLQPNQKEQWVRNLAKQAGISDAELNQIIQQTQQQQGQTAPMQVPVQTSTQQPSMMSMMTNQIIGKLMGNLKI